MSFSQILLALLGVSVIGQAIFASYGLCFYMGFFWGPLHPVLPFLLLGIGVDNIFVIMQVSKGYLFIQSDL